MKTLKLFFVVAVLAFASTPPLAEAQTPARELAVHSISPFEIARVVNQSSRTWRQKRIEIPVDLTETWRQLGIDGSYFSECGDNCKATVFRLDLDEQRGREVLLKLTRSYDFCRYLVFKPVKHDSTRKPRWKLLGYVDHDFNRYEMARHRMVRAFGKNWLVVRGQEGSGSGYSLYGETWYEVSKQGVRPVLHYSVEGHTYPWALGLNWEFKSRALAKTQRNTRPRINLRFVTMYTAIAFAEGQDDDHYVSRRLASFVWNQPLREFVFDGRSSNISESEMDAVAVVETEPPPTGTKIGGSVFFTEAKGFAGSGLEIFLKLKFSRLQWIASGSDAPRKAWLIEFLKQCDATPEKLALAKALANQLPQSRKQR